MCKVVFQHYVPLPHSDELKFCPHTAILQLQEFVKYNNLSEDDDDEEFGDADADDNDSDKSRMI